MKFLSELLPKFFTSNSSPESSFKADVISPDKFLIGHHLFQNIESSLGFFLSLEIISELYQNKELVEGKDLLENGCLF